MYEAKLEFLEGWVGHRVNPFRGGGGGGMNIFWNHTMAIVFVFLFFVIHHITDLQT